MLLSSLSESIGFTVFGNSKLDWLTDQNDTTCNNDKETPVYLALKPPIRLGWSRVVVNSPARLRHIELFYYIANENIPIRCPGPKVNIGDTVQDILCPTADNVTKVTVTINGEAGRGLCSFYLSSACVGTHGARCWYNCSKNCGGLYNACDHVTGICCVPGYTGAKCDQGLCPSGKYGLNCSKDCSIHCAGPSKSCSHINGSCAEGCDPGYTGETCDRKCPSGRHGVKCNESCSLHCARSNNTCSHINGSCAEGCDPGYTGESCDQKCPSGRHGVNCNKSCSAHCAGPNNTCFHVNGSCAYGCDSGYTGETCDQ
ncbi:hypothetical protein RRG08_019132, partial [Elysia crispata]